MPHYLLTTTFYGNWLPGDPRGFVSSVRDRRPEEAISHSRQEHDLYGTPYDRNMPGLYRAAREAMTGEAIKMIHEQAEVLLLQFQETTTFRRWPLLAVAIMSDHLHIVIEVCDDTDSEKVLGDIKAYGSRALNRRWGKPPSGTWWTRKGSQRPKFDPDALRNAILYTLRQKNPLVLWASNAVKAEYVPYIPVYCR